jgi:hypothetical protein
MSIKRIPGNAPVSPAKPSADSDGIAAGRLVSSRGRGAQPDPALPARGSAVAGSNSKAYKHSAQPKAEKLRLAGTHSQQALDKANEVAVRGLGVLYRALHKGCAA